MPGRTLTKSIIWVSLIVLGASCSKFRRIQKSEDWRIRYEAALAYYGDKDYYRAAILFEDILPIVRGLPEGEKVEFYLAYCQYYEETYLLASNQFKTFYETYGRSSLAEEAHFMYAYSLFASAPSPNLDQREGIDAMDAMQVFLNQYPDSKFREKAGEVIKVSQGKLEQKGFNNAKQYLKLRYYQAAIIALDNFKKNFPDSNYLEEAAYLRVVSQYHLADKSLVTLQISRYTQVIEYYKEFVDNFPQSKFTKDAEKLYSVSLNKVNQSKINHNI